MINIDEIKEELGFDEGDNTQDNFLSRSLEAGKRVVERVAGRKFYSEDLISEEFYKFPIIVKNSPFENLVVKRTDNDDEETILEKDTDYQVRKSIIYLERAIATGTKKIVLEYNIKDDFIEIDTIVRNYVKRSYKKNKFMGEKTTAGVDGGSTSWENHLTNEELSTIRGYFGGF